MRAVLAALISLLLTRAIFSQDTFVAQDSIPVPSANAKTVKLSDLPPEVATKIKSQHYVAQDQNIQQAYHQNLQENHQRSAFSAQRAVFEHVAATRPQGLGFSPFAQPTPAGGQPTVAQASHNAAFPRTAANTPDEFIDQPSGPTPSAAYTAPARDAYSAPQAFMPPVHIPPMQPQYSSGIPGRTVNGRRNAVQNFAPQVTRHSTVASTPQPQLARVRRNDDVASPRRTKAQTTQSAPPAAKEDTHVFLQDRIANALSRHFKRGKKSKQQTNTEPLVTNETVDTAPESVLETAALSPPVYQTGASAPVNEPAEIIIDDYQPVSHVDETFARPEQFVDEQSYSEILRGNQYTSRIKGGGIVSGDRPADHRIAAKLDARRRSIERAIHHDNNNDIESFDLSAGEEDTTILDRYEKIRQTSAEYGASGEPKSLRGSAKRPTQRPSRLAAYSRPDKYSPTKKEVRGENVSILLQEEDGADASPFADADDFKPDDDIDLESARDDFDLESDLRSGSGTKDRPNLRDDLRDGYDDSDRPDRSLRDRVRSRLDDELDLEALDREIDEELDEEMNDDEMDNDRPNRAPRKTCREFQDELIAGSIRDISLDISPPAASEGAQYGGLARTWTDRRGNILATGALVDLRRGYVILDSGQKLAYARLSESDLAAVSEFWRLPEVCLIGNRGGSPYRNWTPQVVTWKASNLCHKPLYFENTQLERYGHSRGPVAQPIHSTLHFFTRLVALPYMTGICPPNECEYALGYYRPGNCAPWLKEPIPISLEGIRREALFVTGAAFIP